MGVAASITSELGLENFSSRRKAKTEVKSGLPDGTDILQLVMQVDNDDGGPVNKLWRQEGTSLQQIQEGIFRHLAGTAYRTYKVYFAKHIHSKQDVKTLPYTFTHFVANVRATMQLYQSLGIIPEEGHGPINELVECVDAEFERLKQRIAAWRGTEKTPSQQAEHDRMFGDGQGRDDPIRALEQADIEAHSLHEKHLGKGRMARRGTQVLSDDQILPVDHSKHELHDWEEGFGDEEDIPAEDPDVSAKPASQLSYATADSRGQAFLERWNKVLLMDADEKLEGCMIQIRWWYEQFMPRLCAACSITSDPRTFAGGADLKEAVMDEWFEGALHRNEFAPFGHDIGMKFSECDRDIKLVIMQSWRLTRGYLNGIQKQREREVEAHHRRTGGLSRYVPFIDVYLGTNFMERAEMRVSFPYYLGHSVWRLLHTVPEIADRRSETGAAILQAFKSFFRTFVTTYSCPFCRHHLTSYVSISAERDMYPIEYSLLGLKPDEPLHNITLEDKLDCVSSAMDARMFVWKLHNAVQSSIERNEKWYKQESVAIYTTRWWPNLSAEIARVQFETHGEGSIPVKRVEYYNRMAKPMARLEKLREKLTSASEHSEVIELKEQAEEYIDLLEEAIKEGRFLQRTYGFIQGLEEPAPIRPFRGAYGHYARSDNFTLW